MKWQDERWTDEKDVIHAFCCICEHEVSTHDDAGQLSLEYCGDCGRPTCCDHRTADSASRCDECWSEYKLFMQSHLKP